MKPLLIFWCLLTATLTFAQNDAPKLAYKLLNNIQVDTKVYSVYAKSEDTKFTLKICHIDTCSITQEYIKTIHPDLLASDVLAHIKALLDTNLDLTRVTVEQKQSIVQLKDVLKNSDEADLKARNTELENTLYSIDNEKQTYSAKIVLNSLVPYDITYRVLKQNGAVSKGGENLLEQRMPHKDKADNSKYEDKTELGQGVLKIVDAKIQFFNNKASSIYIKAELTENNTTEKLIFENNSYSVALRYFNKYGSTIAAQTKNLSWITIDYNDVFDYESDQFFNYSIANSQITLSSKTSDEQSSKVIQRRFFDFFTAIVYTDVMGFNTENSNSILSTQAKLLLPLNLRNWKKLTLTRQFVTTANIALNNSFEDQSRFIAIADDETFSNFDLLRKNNLYGKIQLDVLTYESKGWFLNTSLGYTIGFYRTGFRYTQTEETEIDVVTSRQLLSLGHGPYLNFEIRPQTNFGADIFISLEDLNYNDTKAINGRSFKDDILVDNAKHHFAVPYNLINIEANFYWLINPETSKGGIYAKLGSYYHVDNRSIFPQIMVGYATNLTSFVNRFQPRAKDIAAND